MIAATRDIVDLLTDSACGAIDGKKSSSKPFSTVPFEDFADYVDWSQGNNDSQNDTNRTRALFLSYVLLHGSEMSMGGTQIDGGWIRPD